MEHQDWKTVVIRGKNGGLSNENKITESVVREKKGNSVKDIDIHENGAEEKISSELRKKLCDARNGKNITQNDMVKQAGAIGKRITLREVQDAEMGKCTMKQGKQIALIYQKITGVVILSRK